MEHYTCIARFQPKPQKHAELDARLKELVKLTRLEEGCIDYDLCYSQDNHKFAFFVVERFKSKEDFEFHSKQEYLTRFVQDLDALVADASIHVCENSKALT